MFSLLSVLLIWTWHENFCGNSVSKSMLVRIIFKPGFWLAGRKIASQPVAMLENNLFNFHGFLRGFCLVIQASARYCTYHQLSSLHSRLDTINHKVDNTVNFKCIRVACTYCPPICVQQPSPKDRPIYHILLFSTSLYSGFSSVISYHTGLSFVSDFNMLAYSTMLSVIVLHLCWKHTENIIPFLIFKLDCNRFSLMFTRYGPCFMDIRHQRYYSLLIVGVLMLNQAQP